MFAFILKQYLAGFSRWSTNKNLILIIPLPQLRESASRIVDPNPKVIELRLLPYPPEETAHEQLDLR